MDVLSLQPVQGRQFSDNLRMILGRNALSPPIFGEVSPGMSRPLGIGRSCDSAKAMAAAAAGTRRRGVRRRLSG